MISLNYKSDRQRLEFESGKLSTKLTQMIKMAMEHLSIEYPEKDIELVITEIYRTFEEQQKIYLNSTDKALAEKFKKNPWHSVHEEWRGIDIRTFNLPAGVAEKLRDFFNSFVYDKKRPTKKTAIIHDLGTGSHIHVQVM
jgi:hypothetical protein